MGTITSPPSMPPTSPVSAAAAQRRPRSLAQRPVVRVLGILVRVIGSLQLAVALLLLLALLTWLGTLAQIELGLYQAQRLYFESVWLLAELPVSFGGKEFFRLSLPLPGAYLVMAVLLVNLLVGGVLRLRWNWRSLGVLLVHIGMAGLFVQGFVKLHYSVSGHLTLFEGQQDSVYQSFTEWELALLRSDRDAVVERTVPAHAFAHAGGDPVRIDCPGAPFDVEVRHFLENCAALPKGPMVTPVLPVVEAEVRGQRTAVFLRAEPMRKEREQNVAGCYVTVRERGTGKALAETVLIGSDRRLRSFRSEPFVFTVGEERYGLDLRRVLLDLPFTVRLDRFERVTYPGTEMPKEFSSYVTVLAGGQDERQHIYMNNPMRREGYVLYQASWGPQGSRGPFFSQFEVARNPSDRWSIAACTVIAVGLVLHFLRKLRSFLRAERARLETGSGASA